MSTVTFTADRNVVWIASYPKSGNTWVRFLVCNLAFGPQDSAAALNQLVPDIHEIAEVPPPPTQPVLLKTHFPFTPALPLAASTAGAIYVVRDPADVMLSNYHYSQRSGGANAGALAQYLEQYLAARGDPRWITLQMGCWDDHVRSWLCRNAPFPVLALRYEDLLRDTLQAARQIAVFLGLALPSHELERAVAAASFARMREIEEADIHRKRVGIFYKPYLQTSINTGMRFMRAGRAGEAARVFTPQQRQQIEAVFAPLMHELGYADAAQAVATPA